MTKNERISQAKRKAKTIKIVGEHKTLPTEHRNTLLENLTSVDIDSNINIDKLDLLKEDHSF